MQDLVDSDDIEAIRIERGVDWKQKVRSSLGRRMGTNVPFNKARVLDYVLNFVAEKLDAKTIILEPYISTDWADEYQAWYSRTFRTIPRAAIRLHFFAGIGHDLQHVNPDTLFLPRTEWPTHDSSYLGYCVVRPVVPVTVAETVLANPFHGRAGSMLCSPTFKAHILGNEFKVRGMPFLEQDKVVSVCAEADLWMISRYMNAKNISRRFRPSEMARHANLAYSVGGIRDGLEVEQMYNALKSMNLNPEMTYPGGANPADLLRLIYTCVKSETPVIVAIPEHVLTVIGYVYGPEKNKLAVDDTMAAYVHSFIAHDDVRGPYQMMQVGKRRNRQKGSKYDLLTLNNNDVEQCLWVMPDRVSLREADIRLLVDRWLAQGYLSRLTKNEIWTDAELRSLVSCAYLRLGDRFKSDLLKGSVKRDQRLIHYYWHLMFPKNVWIVELSRRTDIPPSAPWTRTVIGEMIFDASAHYNDYINSLLAVHINGRLLYRKRSSSIDNDNMPWGYVLDLQRNSYSPLDRLKFTADD